MASGIPCFGWAACTILVDLILGYAGISDCWDFSWGGDFWEPPGSSSSINGLINLTLVSTFNP